MNNIAVSLLAGAGASLCVGLIGWLTTRRKTKAETADLITQAADRIIRQLELDLGEARVQVQELRSEVRSLRNLVVELGGENRLNSQPR